MGSLGCTCSSAPPSPTWGRAVFGISHHLPGGLNSFPTLVHPHPITPGECFPTPPSLGCSLPHDITIILWVSSKSGSSTFGYIYLDARKHLHQEPIIAYFKSAGREVFAFTCLDFNAMLRAYHLHTLDVSFVGNLPHYLIPMGCRIMAETTYSNNAAPSQLWLPDLPLTSFHSQSYCSHGNQALVGLCGPCPPSSPTSQHPDPNGINPTASSPFLAALQVHPPSFFSMGGSITITHSFGALSPLTNSDTLNIGGKHRRR